MSASEVKKEKKMLPVCLFVAASLFLFFFLLHSIPLWSSDEGRYGEIAREMLNSRNFVIAHFNHIPYLDKPILAPLLTSGAYALFGVNNLTARLIPVLAALLGLFFLHDFSKRIFDRRTANFAALFLLTTLGYVLVGRFAVIDMLMTFWISLSLFAMFRAFWEKEPRLYLLAYVFMGLGTMTKGLIGFVIPGFVFLIFLTWTRNLGELKRMKIPLGILIIALVFLPWLLAAMKKMPGFFDTFIVDQHFKRFATGSYGRKRPLWFFIPLFFALGFPWTFFFPSAAAQGLKSAREDKLKIQFLLSWIAGVIIFFSIPKSKLPYYILPTTVPLALLVGSFFAKRPSASTVQWSWRALFFITVTAVLGLNIYLFFTADAEVLMLKNLAHAGTFFLVVGVSAAFWMQKKNLDRAVVYLAGTLYGALLIAFIGMKILSASQSTAEEAAYLTQVLQPGDEVAVYASPDRYSDLSFHLRKRLIFVGPDFGTLRNQLDLLPPEKRKPYYLERPDFIALFNEDRIRIYTLMEPEWLEEIKQMGLQGFQVVKEGHEKVLIKNF